MSWQLAPKESEQKQERQKQLLLMQQELGKFIRCYREYFPTEDSPDPLAMAEENPTKAAAFFHPETLVLSAEMRVMAWRLLHGDEIQYLHFNYEVGKPHEFRIGLHSFSGKTVEYHSSEWFNVFALRHFGIAVHKGLLALRGYYTNSLGR